MTNRFMALVVILMVSIFSKVSAHEISTAYIDIKSNSQNQLEATMSFHLLELAEELALDSNLDGNVSWGEILEQQEQLQLFVSQAIEISTGDSRCSLVSSDTPQVSSDEPIYLAIPVYSDCELGDSMSITYVGFLDSRFNHKAILRFETNGIEHFSLFDKINRSDTIEIGVESSLTTFINFLIQGGYHILIGLDHILFLCVLLLTVCIYHKDKQWYPIEDKTAIFKRTFWIVTSFTIAHSITLTATALDFLPTFGSWVEVVIAVSILVAAINNIIPYFNTLPRLTFAFGLIHGMGFAGALGDLGVSQTNKVISVLSFNLGVEVGQLLIVLVLLPVLIHFSAKQIYAKKVMPGLSLVIGAISIFWVFERI